MLDYNTIEKILRENRNIIPDKYKKDIEEFFEAFAEKNSYYMGQIVKRWVGSSNPILSLLNIDTKFFTHDFERKHFLYRTVK